MAGLEAAINQPVGEQGVAVDQSVEHDTQHQQQQLGQPVQEAGTSSRLAQPISNDAIQPLLAVMSTELRFLLQTLGVPKEIQARISQLGFKTIETFAMVEDTAAEVRAFIKSDVGLRPNYDEY